MSADEKLSTFFAAWAEPDTATRDAAVDSAIGDTILYADPRTDAPITDVAALKDYVGEFCQMAPGMPVAVVAQSRTLDYVRVTVRFGPEGQGQLGQYTADLDGNGGIVRLIGFAGMGEPA